MRWAGAALFAFLGLTAYWHFSSRSAQADFTGWATDTTQAAIDLAELIPGCPERDCISSIDEPRFDTPAEGDAWLDPRAPVAVVGDRAYPLQILARHEIVNDEVEGRPVAVTYCPLWNTAVAFDRTVGGEVLAFGVSGFLRHRNLVMYDRGDSESLWLQATGEGLVGDATGEVLDMLPIPVMSWADFKEFEPDGRVLSRETGRDFDYDLQPYAGYDGPRGLLERLKDWGENAVLPPMERVVAMGVGGEGVAVPFRVLRESRAVHTDVDGEPVVVFWGPGTVTVLDAATVEDSRDVGAVGAFYPEAAGRTLSFEAAGDGRFTDDATGSTWAVSGRAVAGPLEGSRLEPVTYTNAFWFGWREFRPQTRLVLH
jgi:hypothetical protein